MIKICDKTIVKPLSVIYKNCIDSGIFPDLWKKSNIVPVHSFLGKIIDQILFNSIIEYLQENNLLCETQSGFQPYYSCEYQPLSIVHEIYASFDYAPFLSK